jgi:hypothetical protein
VGSLLPLFDLESRWAEWDVPQIRRESGSKLPHSERLRRQKMQQLIERAGFQQVRT